MEAHILTLFVVILVYCLISAGVGRLAITMPMVFVSVGVLAALSGLTFQHGDGTAFHVLAEVTLALLLFADATLLDRTSLNRIGQRAARMLLLGLPLAIVFGTLINHLLLPDWPLWEVCLLAALLAPTDAALGQSIQSNARIPQTIRNALSAESGLNDGLALPFVIFFAGMAVSDSGADAGKGALLLMVAVQVGVGALVGIGGGVAAGFARNFVLDRNLMNHGLGQVATLALIGVIFFAAEHAGGNSFVAVFASGIAYANATNGPVHQAREFIEGDGQFLAMLSFFFIGALLVPYALEHATFAYLAVILVSLILVRPATIWLSLMGTDTPPNERLFYGWFGPRGLATALFAVFVLMDFEGLAQREGILVVASMAVLISAFVHGFTANWASQLFRLDNPPD